MRVIQDLILIGVAESSDIFNAELNVPDKVSYTSFVTLRRAHFLCCFIEDFDGVPMVNRLYPSYAEACPEGVSLQFSAK